MVRRQSIRMSSWVAASFSFPEGETADGWGVLLDLGFSGVRLQTRTSLAAGQEIFLSFSLGGQHFNRLHSQACRVRRDPDGYFVCGLKFLEMVDRKALKEALVELLVKGAAAPPAHHGPLSSAKGA